MCGSFLTFDLSEILHALLTVTMPNILLVKVLAVFSAVCVKIHIHFHILFFSVSLGISAKHAPAWCS